MAVTKAMASDLTVGMVGRFFPDNWRPPEREIEFAAASGFAVIDFKILRPGGIEQELRCDLAEVRAALDHAGVRAAVEMILRIDGQGRTAEGDSIVAAFEKNLDAITALGCGWVHLHLVLRASVRHASIELLEQRLPEELAETAALARGRGFRFGFEHNSGEERLFASPQSCDRVLAASADIGFVWDINHTAPNDLAAFKRFLPRAILIHASDTPLPKTNHHLPIGFGTIDFADRLTALLEAGFSGPIVLEIGGLPRSGGPGKDTDEALGMSRERLLAALAQSLSIQRDLAAER